MTAAVTLPGPPGSMLFGNAPGYNRDPLNFLLHCAQTYGDVVPLRFGPRRAFLLRHPDLIEQVLVTQHRNFIKSAGLRRSSVLFGRGLLTSEGDFWRQQRRMIQPAFHRERIAGYARSMVEMTQAHLADWRDGQTRDLQAEMMRLTLDIAVQTLFGAKVAEVEKVAEALDIGQNTFARWIAYIVMLPEWFPTPNPPRLSQAIWQLDQIVYGLIRERRAAGADTGDLLSMLLRAQDEEGQAVMTDRQIRDEILTLFLAGHETTALAITWTFSLLAQHPEVEAQLHAELQTVLQGRAPEPQDRPLLKFTEQVVQEAMRLYPPVWIIGRQSLHACEIGGYAIPAHTGLLMSQYVVHRDPRFFSDPDTFNPARWTDDFAKSLPRFAYFPFGGGPRICIGNTFAMMEAVLLLATMASQFQMRRVSNQPVELQPAVTLRPRHGMKMRLTRRGA